MKLLTQSALRHGSRPLCSNQANANSITNQHKSLITAVRGYRQECGCSQRNFAILKGTKLSTVKHYVVETQYRKLSCRFPILNYSSIPFQDLIPCHYFTIQRTNLHSQVGSSLDQDPSAWQVRFENPCKKYPGSQEQNAIAPNVVLEKSTSPLSGDGRPPQSITTCTQKTLINTSIPLCSPIT